MQTFDLPLLLSALAPGSGGYSSNSSPVWVIVLAVVVAIVGVVLLVRGVRKRRR